jgi:hypothetical protein
MYVDRVTENSPYKSPIPTNAFLKTNLIERPFNTIYTSTSKVNYFLS